jgi:hypothetical protein
MKRLLTFAALALLLTACLTWAADSSWTGVVSDSHCGLKHAAASDEAATCVASCVKSGAKYVLASAGKLYQLEPQNKINADLAGREAKITGTLKGDTITVTSASAVPKKN